MEIGIKGYQEQVVTEEQSARLAGSGTLDVYATPYLAALMELTAMHSVMDQLEEGCCTVGTALNIRHLSATPIGMRVHCETELIKVEGRVLTFAVKAYDEAGLIAEGEHERVIVYADRLQAKADAKLASIEK